MSHDAVAAASPVLLVGCDAATTARLRASVAREDRLRLELREITHARDVPAELRARSAGVVLLGPLLREPERSSLCALLRGGSDVLIVTLAAEASAPAPEADEHIAADEDPARVLRRLAREVRLRDALREALERAERMALLARAVAGAAHDFGNLLQVIQGRTDVLRSEIPRSEAADASLAAISEAGDRAIELVRRLLVPGAERPQRAEPLAVDAFLQGMRPICEGLLTGGQWLTLELHGGDALVKADAAQLERALVNLVVNASHAVGPDGRLWLRSRREHLDPAAAAGFDAAVVIELEDDGTGMSRAVAERAFEPFFSTRSAEDGSGLGLSSVMDAVQCAGGTAELDSAPGRGTRVRLVLPEHGAVRGGARFSTGLRGPRSRPRILVVDDEPLLVAVVRNVLERAGLDHLTASSAEEAEALFGAYGASVDLLVTDVTMPGRGGRGLYESPRARRPDLPVIFVSGHVHEPWLVDTLDEGGPRRHLLKPFRPAELLATIDELLAKAPATTNL